MADLQKRLTGMRNRAAGELFEKWISVSCEYYWKLGYACIEKTPEPMKPISPYGKRGTGQFVACYTKQAQPDFKGSLCDGSCIIFDAKHTDSDRIMQSAITKTQEEILDRYETMKAKCYVVISLKLKDFYRVPWSVWKQMKERFGHKYMSCTELEAYRVPDRNCMVLLLEGVEINEDSKIRIDKKD